MQTNEDKLICPKCGRDWSPGISKIKAMQFLSHKLADNDNSNGVVCQHCGAVFSITQIAAYLRSELNRIKKK